MSTNKKFFARNELIAETLSFSERFKLPATGFMPREVIAAVRELTKYLENEESVREFLLKLESGSNRNDGRVIEKAMYSSSKYSAVFREDGLHLFKTQHIMDRKGDVVIPKEDFDEFLSLVIHSDWETDFENWIKENSSYINLSETFSLKGKAFTFDWRKLHYLRKDFITSDDSE